MSHDPPDPLDPQGLMREAFRIEGITLPECRALFFDWALSLPDGADTAAAIRAHLARHPQPDHPMTTVLTDGLPAWRGRIARRGGWRARRSAEQPD